MKQIIAGIAVGMGTLFIGLAFASVMIENL